MNHKWNYQPPTPEELEAYKALSKELVPIRTVL